MDTDIKYPEVIILSEGFSKDENDSVLANCTCTLIKSKTNIVVDTMTSWDGEKLKAALSNNNINCNDVGFVICTHGHSDHVGCSYLFPKAIHIVGFSVSHKTRYFNHDFRSGKEYVIDNFVKVIPTPGHTLQDVSVIVKTDKGVVAVTGDLFEKKEDLEDDSIWKNAGSDSEELQLKNRNMILSIADFIVPGHGPLFKVLK